MATHPKAPSAVRARIALLLVPALALPLAGGCKHKRYSMRPVYAAPAPAVVVPEPMLETPAPVRLEPSPSFESPSPGFDSAPPALEPVAPPADDALTPSATTIPPGEPDLRAPRGGTGLGPAPELNGPQASRGAAPRRALMATSRTARRVGIREELAAYVNDPQDLFQPPKADRPWRYIVLHHSARPEGGYDQIDAEHRKALGWDGCGYHFVIGNGTGSPDGQVEVSRRWSNQKAGVHCRDAADPAASEYGIGICLVGDMENAPPTPKQLAAARALVAYLSDRYQIPAARVATHKHVSARDTVCPGRYFPRESILGDRSVALR